MIKGYPDQQKIDAGAPQFGTVAPIREQQYGADVVAHSFCQSIVSDAAEASSTTRVINATAHVALRGDIISWTSGSLITKEYRVHSTTTNTITVVEAMSVAPTAADTFDILRQKAAVVSSTGGIGVSLANDANTGLAGAATLRTVEAGRARGIAPVSYDHAVPVTTVAYTQIIASTAAQVTSIYVADYSGSFIILALGAAGLEVNQMYLNPGFAGWIPLRIAAGTRVSIKALDTATSSNLFIISGLS